MNPRQTILPRPQPAGPTGLILQVAFAADSVNSSSGREGDSAVPAFEQHAANWYYLSFTDLGRCVWWYQAARLELCFARGKMICFSTHERCISDCAEYNQLRCLAPGASRLTACWALVCDRALVG